jgi:hypothetical protein
MDVFAAHEGLHARVDGTDRRASPPRDGTPVSRHEWRALVASGEPPRDVDRAGERLTVPHLDVGAGVARAV